MIGHLVLCLALASAFAADTKDVTIPNGQVRGALMTNSDGQSMYGFRGIPYGKSPVGELRFQAPQAVEPWDGVFDATAAGPVCTLIQMGMGDDGLTQSEDCLRLNVYTPVNASDEAYPVMFWIYGGAFVGGSADYSNYGPDDLVQEGVIVVTVNYRLGFYGFLSTGDTEISGNNGLKDQQLALKWVNQNIAYFGGDPEKVTVFGESAGGKSTGAHLWNKKSAGLFRAVICQSGCSIDVDITDYQFDPLTNARALAKLVDSSITDSSTTAEIRELLQGLDSTTLYNAIVKLGETTGAMRGFVLEPESDDAFMSKWDMYEVIARGDFNIVPAIIGTVSEEALVGYRDVAGVQRAAAQLDADLTAAIPGDLTPILKEGANTTEIANLIKQAYVGDSTFAENLAMFLRLSSDHANGRALVRQPELMANLTTVYKYKFSYWGTKSGGNVIVPGAGKVAHMDELAYLFRQENSDLHSTGDFLARQRLVRLWANFAKYLNPTPVEDPVLENVIWEPVTFDNIHFLNINDTVYMEDNDKVTQMAMWDHVYETYAEHPFMGF